MDAALGENCLDRLYELVDERIKLVGGGTCLAHAQVQRVMQVLLVVRTRIEVHREQILRGHACASRVQLQLADRDAHPVCSQVAKPEDTAGIGYTNKTQVFFRPVLEYVFHSAATCDREIHAAGLAIDVTELQAGFTNRRVINDRQEPRRVRHDGPVEERFVVVEQVHQVDVALQVRGLLRELKVHALQLQVLGLYDVG